MIFVAVGTQLAFDRLIHAVDQWAAARGRQDVFAQVGPTKSPPSHIAWKNFITADEFRARTAQADVVVAHAGMGTIIGALELGKPIIVMPRKASVGEHRNEHQLATARRFLEQGRISVAFDEVELVQKLDALDQLKPAGLISNSASPELMAVIQAFIEGKRPVTGLGSSR